MNKDFLKYAFFSIFKVDYEASSAISEAGEVVSNTHPIGIYKLGTIKNNEGESFSIFFSHDKSLGLYKLTSISYKYKRNLKNTIINRDFVSKDKFLSSVSEYLPSSLMDDVLSSIKSKKNDKQKHSDNKSSNKEEEGRDE